MATTTQGHAPSSIGPARWAAALGPVAVVAASLPRLGAPLWRDEWATWMFTQLPAPDLVTAVQRVDAVFAWYYLMLHPLVALGVSAPSLRLVSLAAMALACWRVVRLLPASTHPLAAGTASLTLALNPVSIQAATSARSYALAMLLSVVATELLLGARERRVAYPLVCVAAVMAHPFALALAPAHLVVALVRRSRVARTAAGWALACAASAPVLALSPGQGGQVQWVQPLGWSQLLVQTGHALGSASTAPAQTTPRVLTTLLVISIAAARAVRSRRLDPCWTAAGLLVLAPPAALVTLSALGRPSYVDRYLIAVPVGASLLAGLVVASGLASRRWAGLGLALCCALLAGWNLRGVQTVPGRTEGHPAVEQFLARTVAPGDIVVVHQGASQTGLAYGYASGLHDPAWQRDAVAALVSGQTQYVVRTVVDTGGPAVTTRAGLPGGAATAWLVQTYGPVTPPAPVVGGMTCRPGAQHRFGETRVVRLACSAT